MTDANGSFAEALAAIIKPIVKEAVLEAMNVNSGGAVQRAAPERSFLTVKQAAETCGLGASTIRLLIRKRRLAAQRVGRRVLIKQSDLKLFLESDRIPAMPLDT